MFVSVPTHLYGQNQGKIEAEGGASNDNTVPDWLAREPLFGKNKPA
jgi:hypothetical protein